MYADSCGCRRSEHGGGDSPRATDLSCASRQNESYRRELWTGQQLQLVLMSLPAGGEIGWEVHPDTDQLLCIESGCGVACMGPAETRVSCRQRVSDGYAVLVPAGTWHNICNTGNGPLKLYTVYAPPHHPRGTVQATKDMAEDTH